VNDKRLTYETGIKDNDNTDRIYLDNVVRVRSLKINVNTTDFEIVCEFTVWPPPA